MLQDQNPFTLAKHEEITQFPNLRNFNVWIFVFNKLNLCAIKYFVEYYLNNDYIIIIIM